MKTIQTTVLIMLIMCLWSCEKEIYTSNADPAYLQEGNLFDHLKKDAELTQFVSLLKKTGYDSVLVRKDLFTVLAIKNGSFGGIDTIDITALKKIMSMHILPSAIPASGLNGKRVMTISGKYVKFFEADGYLTVNNVRLTGTEEKATNGRVYKVDNVITPLTNLLDIIYTDPKYSIYSDYIKSSYVIEFDPIKNTVLRFDSLGKPIYKLPYIMIQNSDYMDFSRLSDESEESTLFIPTNDAINLALGRLLSERGNNSQLIIPRISSAHSDTTAGGYYFSKNIPYRGDTLILKDYIFKNILVKGGISNLVSGINTFTNKAGNQFKVSSSQVQNVAATASNGTYYSLNDITLPNLVYRKTFLFDPHEINPLFPFKYFNGAKNTNQFNTAPLNATYDRYSIFDFGNVNGKFEFTFPFVTKGNYNVVLRVYPKDASCIMNSFYNGLPLKQNVILSNLFSMNGVSTDIFLGSINISNSGPASINFTCADVSPLVANSFKLYMNTIKLIPID